MISAKKACSVVLISMAGVLISYTYGQEIQFSGSPVTIGEAFRQIENQTDYLISYPSNGVDLTRSVPLQALHLPLGQALTDILKDSGLAFDIRGNHILISVPQKEDSDARISEPSSWNSFPSSAENRLKSQPAAEPDDSLLNQMQSEMDRLKRELEARRPKQEITIPKEPLLDIQAFQSEQYMFLQPGTHRLPPVALRVNLLYGLGTLTPNGGIEVGLDQHSTLLFTGSYNGWRKNEPFEDNKKLWHWTIGTEYRYWLCERFNGHFFGAHAFYGQYNIAGRKVPFVFEKGSEYYRYQGYGAGAGVSYGYQFQLGKHWNAELNAGIGLGFLKYDKWDCEHCGEKLEGDVSRTFVAPTKLGVSIIYLF